MSNNKKQDSTELLVIQFLKKNKNFLIKHPILLNELDIPSRTKSSDKLIDLNAYLFKKLKGKYNLQKKQMLEILRAGSSNLASQKKILKTSIKILNTKSLKKLIDVIVNELGSLLDCDIINCFFTSNKIKHQSISQIDKKLTSIYFKDQPQTYLNQNPNGIPLFFSNKTKIVKSYILLKIVYEQDRFILAMGSKNINKFTKEQKVDLIEYLIQVIQIKLVDLS